MGWAGDERGGIIYAALSEEEEAAKQTFGKTVFKKYIQIYLFQLF